MQKADTSYAVRWKLNVDVLMNIWSKSCSLFVFWHKYKYTYFIPSKGRLRTTKNIVFPCQDRAKGLMCHYLKFAYITQTCFQLTKSACSRFPFVQWKSKNESTWSAEVVRQAVWRDCMSSPTQTTLLSTGYGMRGKRSTSDPSEACLTCGHRQPVISKHSCDLMVTWPFMNKHTCMSQAT